MIKAKKEGIILQKRDLPFENEGVLNPAILQEGNTVHVFYRAVEEKNKSTIGYCRLEGPLKVVERYDQPLLTPTSAYEQHGIEDPRIVKIDDAYYITYVAFDGANALGALATSTDLKHFELKGIIVPKITLADFDKLTRDDVGVNMRYLSFNPGAKILADKDLVLFPRKIKGKFTFLHRIKPDIQIVSVNSFDELTPDFWLKYIANFGEHIFLKPKYDHEEQYIGGGCPPIETEHGWLILYHGVRRNGERLEYSCGAALMNLDDPQKEIARLPYPLIKPELDYELTGDVDDVCFPTGTAQFDGKLYIYYGAADELIACASVDLEELLDELVAIGRG